MTYTSVAEGQMLPGVEDVAARRFTSRRATHRLARH